MKTNIKMRVTPEQLEKICKIVGEGWLYFKSAIYMYIFNDGSVEVSYSKENWNKYNLREIDADLFIRTNGTCEEIQKPSYRKTKILNQKKELDRLNLKLKDSISLKEHNKIVEELKKDINFRKETIKNTLQIGKDRLKEIEQLKAENKSLKESSKISCNTLHSQKDKTGRLELNYVIEQSNYKKEIEKLKAVIEYLESKVK